MVGNGSRAVAGQFIDRMDSPYHSPYRTANSKRGISGLNEWWHATHGWNQHEIYYHKNVDKKKPMQCARDKKCNSRTLLSLINDPLLVDHIDHARNDSAVRNCLRARGYSPLASDTKIFFFLKCARSFISMLQTKKKATAVTAEFLRSAFISFHGMPMQLHCDLPPCMIA